MTLDEAVRELNRYNRARRAGKQMGVGLIIYLDKGRINVMERKLPTKEKADGQCTPRFNKEPS